MRALYILLWLLITAGCAYFASQSPNCPCNDGASGGDEVAKNMFTIKGENGFSADCNYAVFERSSYQLANANDDLQSCYDEIAGYLNDKSDKRLIIEGFYSEDEVNNSIYANLGEARASQLKRILQSNFNVAANRLGIGSKLVDDTAFRTDTLLNGYGLTWADMPDAANAAEYDKDGKITLRFNTGSSDPIMNSEIRSDFAAMIAYLEANPNENILVTGHTDQQGDAANNQVLGQERADEIKEYLVRNGINGNRIETDSKGESAPISSNDAENRRVEVSVK